MSEHSNTCRFAPKLPLSTPELQRVTRLAEILQNSISRSIPLLPARPVCVNTSR